MSAPSAPDVALDRDLQDAVADLFGRAVDPGTVTAAEEHGLPGELWATVAELGFTLVGVDESAGGSGGTVLDALVVALLAGRHAVPLPLVENHLAAWALSASGVAVDLRPTTVAPGTRRDEVTDVGDGARGVLHDVAWASGADRIVAVGDDGVLLVIDPADCRIEPGRDLAGQPRDVVHFARAEHRSAGPGVTPRALRLRGALLRAGQSAGAMEALARITVAHCAARHQFGRPLNAFQAVQQHLVTVIQSAELAATSVVRAGMAACEREASFEITAAKLVTDRCAADAARAAHQAHGAISMTREYSLQHLTRRLHAWRGEFGAAADLADALGSAVAAGDSFFAAVAAERDSPEVASWPAP